MPEPGASAYARKNGPSAQAYGAAPARVSRSPVRDRLDIWVIRWDGDDRCASAGGSAYGPFFELIVARCPHRAGFRHAPAAPSVVAADVFTIRSNADAVV
jgi:hypothetical protein